MARAGDPQLHTHVVVANLTRAQGRYTALDAHALYEHKSAAGAIYRAELRAEVCDRLPWVSWRTAGWGLFEIDGVPDGVLRHFSQRRVEIEERAMKLAGVAAGERARFVVDAGASQSILKDWFPRIGEGLSARPKWCSRTGRIRRLDNCGDSVADVGCFRLGLPGTRCS